MMNFLWGNQSKPATPTPPLQSAEQTAEQLEDTIFALELKRETELETAARYDAEARKYAKTDTKRATAAMRQRNTYRESADLHGRQIQKLSETLRTIGSTSENIELAETYKASATALGSLIKTSKAYDVGEIVDELDVHMRDADDLNQAMARPFGGSAMAEEMDEELRAEMESWGEGAQSPPLRGGEVGTKTTPTPTPVDLELPDIPQKSRKDGTASVRLPV